MRTVSRCFFLLVLVAVSALSFGQTPSFQTIGGGFIVHGMSGDGNTLVGELGGQPAAWSTTQGVYMLSVTAPYDHGYASDASFDGKVIVGNTRNGTATQASIWRNNVRTDSSDKRAMFVSNDGTFFVTWSEAYDEPVWHSATQTKSVGGIYDAEAMSGDGQFVSGPGAFYYGTVDIWDSSGQHKEFYHNSENDPYRLTALTLHGEQAYGIDTDEAYKGAGTYIYWKEVRTNTIIKQFNYSVIDARAVIAAVADDNSVASLADLVHFPGTTTVIPLADLLKTQGVDASSFTGIDIRAVSSDGLVLCGTARDASGTFLSWRASLGLFGTSDVYKIVPNTSFHVAAPGVKANDLVPSSATAVLVDQPQNGTVTLAADGSFTYHPAANFIGRDSFTYKISKNGHTGPAVTAVLKVGVPQSLTLTPSGIAGGGKVSAKVILNFVAFAPTEVKVSASKPTLVTMPSSVVVPAGQRFTSFSIGTARVATTTNTTITATLSTVSVSSGLTIGAYSPAKVTVMPNPISGGLRGTVHVELWKPAPAGGVTVNLSSSNTFYAKVPASYTVPAGAQSFNVSVVTYQSQFPNGVQITASGDNGSASGNFNVIPPTITSISPYPTSVKSGNRIRLTVNLNTPANRYTYYFTIGEHSGYTIANAQSGDVNVDVGRTDNQEIDYPITVRGTNGEILTTSVHVTPSALTGVKFDYGSTLVGGTPLTIRPEFDGIADPGSAVTFTSSNTSVVPTPAAKPGGSTVTVQTNGVTATTTVTITATYKGITKSGSVTVTPAALKSLGVNPVTVKGGATSTGTVTLNGFAGPGGIKVTLTSGNTAAATVPASVTVPQNADHVTFTITTKPVTSTTSFAIYAAYGGSTKAVSFNVTK